MATKKRSTKKMVGRIFDLPDDVLDILSQVIPGGSVEDGIVHLARSYDVVMEEQGQEGHPVVIPHDAEDGRVEPDGMPSISDIERVMKDVTQPQGSLGDIQVLSHNKNIPLGKDGLVSPDYVLASDIPIINDLIMTDQYIKTYEIRFQAIREVLSRVPEDAWSGASIASLVDRTYQELVNGRRGIEQKT